MFIVTAAFIIFNFTAIFLNKLYRLIFVIGVKCVFCDVWIVFSNFRYTSGLKGLTECMNFNAEPRAQINNVNMWVQFRMCVLPYWAWMRREEYLVPLLLASRWACCSAEIYAPVSPDSTAASLQRCPERSVLTVMQDRHITKRLGLVWLILRCCRYGIRSVEW
jgi:hypothetical protein